MSIFFDTNILVYSVSLDPADATKRGRAIALLQREDGALSIQVLQEFYTQATRPTRLHRLTHRDAADLVKAWTRFRVQPMTLEILNAALEIKAVHGFSLLGLCDYRGGPCARMPGALYRRHEPWPRGRRRSDHQSISVTRL